MPTRPSCFAGRSPPGAIRFGPLVAAYLSAESVLQRLDAVLQSAALGTIKPWR